MFLSFKNLSGVSKKELSFFSRQLASLLRSGIPILKALDVYLEQAENKNFKAVISQMREKIKNGSSFSASIKNYFSYFPPFYRAMVASGENSGSLADSLYLIAGYYIKENELLSKIKSALAYPALVFVVGILTVFYIFVRVMPQIIPLFDGLDIEKPLATQVLIAVSRFLQTNWFWFFLGISIFFAILKRAMKNELFLYRFSAFRLGLPLIGPLLFKSNVARFSRALSIALNKGVPVISAVESVIPVLNECYLRQNLKEGCKELAFGRSIKDVFTKINIFPPFVISLVSMGQESGMLANAFSDIADSYEEDCHQMIRTLTNLLEPVMVLLVGLFVGFIVAAVLVPVLDLNFISI